MKKRICRVCHEMYDRQDDRDFGGPADPEWSPKDHRCYQCYLFFLNDIFGGWMEPCFTLNGEQWIANGKVPEDSPARDQTPISDIPGNEDIPF